MPSNKRTINGRPIEEVLEALSSRLPYYDVAQNDNDYLPKDLVDEWLDMVLGMNYSFELTQAPQLIEIGSKKTFVCSGTLSIYDDDNTLVGSRSAGGGHDLIVISSTGQPKDISSDYSSSVSSCKKKCAKEFGVGRYLSIEDKLPKWTKDQKSNFVIPNLTRGSVPPNSSKGTRPKQSNHIQNNSSNSNIGDSTIRVKLESKFETFSSCVRAEVTVLSSNERTNFVIYNKDKEQIGASLVDQLLNSSPGVEFNCSVKTSTFRGKNQLVLVNLPYTTQPQNRAS